MSIKQEHITEPRVIAIRSTVICDGCGAKMAEEESKVSSYVGALNHEILFELAAGWVEMAKGAYGNRTKAHSCPKCGDRSVDALLGR